MKKTLKRYINFKSLMIMLFSIIIVSWTLYNKYDIEEWNDGKERHLISLHQFEKVSAPSLTENQKCIEDYILHFQYHGDNAVFRCGGFMWPFYDEITIDKNIVDEAYKTSLALNKNSKKTSVK